MVSFRTASDQSLLVTFHDRREAARAYPVLAPILKAPGIRNIHPAYCSLLIVFDSLELGHEEVEKLARELMSAKTPSASTRTRTVEIPVVYDGPDLKEVAEICGLRADEVVEIHAGTVYTVYFMGFVPGFAYLGDLPEQIAAPRLKTPRKSVPAGSVAIGGSQTAVYPISTPGGWRLVGRTALELFNPAREKMSLLEIGDRVRFRPV